MAEGVTVANAFVQIMPSMKGAESSITDAILPSMDSAGSKAGESFGGMFKGKVGALLKGAGAAAIGYMAFDKLKDTFQEVESGFNKVVLATGATGDAAENLKTVYKNVSGNVVGSFDEIGSAVGELNTRLGLNGKELEGASESAMKYAKVTGQDATKAVQDVTRMMNNAGIPASEYAATLDKLTVAGQAAGIDVGQLATSVNDNASAFKAMGFSTDEAIAMLASFEKSGVNTSAILTGMRKGIKTFTDAGEPAGQAFKDFVSGVQNGSVSMEDAIEIFGSKAGVAMFDAAQKGQLSFEDMYNTISNSDGALDSAYQNTLTAQEKFELLGKKVQTGIYDILEPIVDAIEPYLDDILAAVGDAVSWTVEYVVPVVKTAIDAIGMAIQVLSDTFGPPIQAIIGFVGDAGKNFDTFAKDAGKAFDSVGSAITDELDDAKTIGSETVSAFTSLLSGDFDGAAKHAGTAFTTLKDNIDKKLDVAKTVVTDAADAIGDVLGFPDLGDTVEGVFNDIEDFMKDPIGNASKAISDAVDDIADFLGFDDLGDTVSGIFADIQSFMEDPIGSAKDFIDGIIKDIENAFSWMKIEIPSFELPHINWDWKKVGPVSIPWNFRVDWYAKGGIIDGATLIGAGEAGPEAIVPLTAPNLKPFSEGVANELNDEFRALRDELRNMRLVLNIDGRSFAEATVGEMDRAMGAMNRRSKTR